MQNTLGIEVNWNDMNEHNQYSITAHTDKSRNKVIVVCALNIHGYNLTNNTNLMSSPNSHTIRKPWSGDRNFLDYLLWLECESFINHGFPYHLEKLKPFTIN